MPLERGVGSEAPDPGARQRECKKRREGHQDGLASAPWPRRPPIREGPSPERASSPRYRRHVNLPFRPCGVSLQIAERESLLNSALSAKPVCLSVRPSVRSSALRPDTACLDYLSPPPPLPPIPLALLATIVTEAHSETYPWLRAREDPENKVSQTDYERPRNVA